MKLAIIGSRELSIDNLGDYLPKGVNEIVSGGAKGIDTVAAKYAEETGIPLTVFLPQYRLYGRGAPIVRNRQIVEYADAVLAFWDGKSNGTRSIIALCQKLNKPCQIVRLP